MLLVLHIIISAGCLAVTITPAVATWSKVTIVPQDARIRFRDTTTTTTVTCNSLQPINRCQFRIDEDVQVYPDPPAGWRQNEWNSVGTRLSSCSLSFTRVNIKYGTSLVECRVHSEANGWDQAAVVVYRADSPPVNMTVDSREVVAKPGDNVTLGFKVNEGWIAICRHFWGNSNSDSELVNLGPEIEENRKCEVTLNRVTEKDNRLHFFAVKQVTSQSDIAIEVDFIRLTVAADPSAVNLTKLDVTGPENGSYTLVARCVVSGGRPPPTITWYMGGQEITHGTREHIAEDPLPDSFEDLPVMEVLVAVLRPQDAGKDVWCSAKSLASSKPMESNRKKIPGRPEGQEASIPGPPDHMITCLGHQLPLKHMEELHKFRMAAEAEAARLNLEMAIEEHEQRMTNMGELHRMQLQLGADRARILETNAKQATEELAYQREFHKNESQKLQP